MIKYREAKTEEDLQRAFDIRYIVELEPQGLLRSDIHKHDLNGESVTLVGLDGKNIVASSTSFIIEPGKSELVYLAVLPDFQRKGLGKGLVLASEKILRGKGVRENAIYARTHLETYYSALGYKSIGEVHAEPGFAEKGIFHQRMIKQL